MSFGCLICTEVYETNEKTEKIPVILRKCGHVFHSLCLETWLNSSKTCPICRSKVSLNERSFGRVHFTSIDSRNSSFDVDFEPQVAKALQESLIDAKIQELQRENSELKLQLAIKESMKEEEYSLEAKLKETLQENEELRIQLIKTKLSKERVKKELRNYSKEINTSYVAKSSKSF